MFNEELKFPVQWHHKIICDKTVTTAYDDIVKILRSNGFNDNPEAGSESAGGKYVSWRVSLTFNDRETMHRVGEQLHAVPGVKFLI